MLQRLLPYSTNIFFFSYFSKNLFFFYSSRFFSGISSYISLNFIWGFLPNLSSIFIQIFQLFHEFTQDNKDIFRNPSKSFFRYCYNNSINDFLPLFYKKYSFEYNSSNTQESPKYLPLLKKKMLQEIDYELFREKHPRFHKKCSVIPS